MGFDRYSYFRDVYFEMLGKRTTMVQLTLSEMADCQMKTTGEL